MTPTGLFVPLITPFDAAGAVDLAGLETLAGQLLDDGATGLVALGTTGEPSSLDAEEKRAIVDVASRICRHRGAPLIVGANSVAKLRALGDRAEVTAALTLVPPFLRPGEAGVFAYFTELAAASPVPLVVYHVPHRTGQALSVAALHDLASLPGVCGLKYSPGQIDTATAALLADPPPGLAILGGDDTLISPLLALGAQGGILASAHLATTQYAQLVAAWRAGDVGTARPLGHRLALLSAALFAEPNPTVIKAVLYAEGRIATPRVRLPLVAAATSTAEEARRLLDRAAEARTGG
jgi:4-hydroxy-tetrahydrodipicolinate synthase